MAEILTIIVTYNGMKWIERCIRSVYASTGAESDIMVVDNGSTDGTLDWIQENEPGVKVVKNSENLGFGAANNIGFKFALEKDYDYVYLLNQDAWVYPETFATLLRAFESTVKSGDTRLIPGILSPMQMTAGLTKMDRQFQKHCAKTLEKSQDEVVPVDFVMAAHWMISRDCLLKTGGFCPEFPHYGEDNNYVQRAKYHGFCTAVVKTATAVHDRSSRKRPKAYRMDLKCINARVNVCNPNKSPFRSLLKESCRLLAMSCLHFSTATLKGIKVLFDKYDDLKEVRKASRKPGAFLNS